MTSRGVLHARMKAIGAKPQEARDFICEDVIGVKTRPSLTLLSDEQVAFALEKFRVPDAVLIKQFMAFTHEWHAYMNPISSNASKTEEAHA
jgi:hypothetical protein